LSQGCGSGSAWICIIFASWLRIRISQNLGSYEAQMEPDGRGRSKWSPGSSVHQKSKIRITFMRSRIRLRVRICIKGGSWIRILNKVKSWNRIQIRTEVIRIRNTALIYKLVVFD
jgi:hypothetical protein